MVRRATKQSGSGKATASPSALGPRGRGLFGRLFGAQKPAHQSTQRRREAASFAIASGKGGTGKSFFATNLAILLSQRLKSVVLVDCDFGLACDHLLLGVTPEQTLQHFLASKTTVDELRVTTHEGLQLVPGGSGVMQMTDLDDRQLLMLGGMLGELAIDSDALVLDVGAGISPQNVLSLLAADLVILVTQPEIAALTDAYAVIKCCVQRNENMRFAVVVNRVMKEGHGQATFERLASVANKHVGVQLDYLGEIADDPQITQRRLNQLPVVLSDPDGATAVSMHAIADQLQKLMSPMGCRLVEAQQGLEARFREHRLFLGT